MSGTLSKQEVPFHTSAGYKTSWERMLSRESGCTWCRKHTGKGKLAKAEFSNGLLKVMEELNLEQAGNIKQEREERLPKMDQHKPR